jgi:hypothetical protein
MKNGKVKRSCVLHIVLPDRTAGCLQNQYWRIMLKQVEVVKKPQWRKPALKEMILKSYKASLLRVPSRNFAAKKT